MTDGGTSSDEEFFDALSESPVFEPRKENPPPSAVRAPIVITVPATDAPTRCSYEFDRFLRKVAPMAPFPPLQDMLIDFSKSRQKLPDHLETDQCSVGKGSLASWGKQLLMQTQMDEVQPFTVTAEDHPSAKGDQAPLNGNQSAMLLSTSLKRSQSSHSSGKHKEYEQHTPVNRLWSSANNSCSGAIEREPGWDILNDDPTLPPIPTKSSSLTRDFCGINLSPCFPGYPLEDLATMRHKYSSAEMVIDALTSEFQENLRRNTQADLTQSGSSDNVQPVRQDPNGSVGTSKDTVAVSAPIRPPRMKKVLRNKSVNGDDASSCSTVNGLRVPSLPSLNASPTPSRASSEPVNRVSVPRRPGSKERTSSLKRDQIMECANPLSLHMMRLTRGENKEDSEAESATSSDTISSSRLSIFHNRFCKGTSLRSAVQKKMKTMWHRTHSRQQLPAKEESSSSETDELPDGSRVVQIRAAHHHKGPFYFEQLKLVQDLKGHHIGAVWCAKFSDCGRLLATAGQDSVIRVWVLKSAFKHFSDMRARYCSKRETLKDPPSRQNSFTRLVEAKHRAKFEIDDGSSHSSRGGGDESDKAPPPIDDSWEDAWAPFMPNPICSFKGHTSDVLDVCWSKNYFILSSSMDRTVRLWHLSRFECLCRFQHSDFVTSIAFSVKDDRYFVSGSLDGKIRLWLITEKKVVTWNEVEEGQLVTAVTYVKSGDLIAVGTYDGRCIFYTADKLAYHAQIDLRRYGFKRRKACKITGLDSYHDKLLVTCNDSRIRLYDVRDISLVCKYRGFTNSSSQIRARFSHDGQFIISGSEDCMVYIWKTRTDSNTLQLPRRKDRSRRWESIKAHGAVVTSALFAPKPDVIFAQIERAKRKLNTEEYAASDAEEKRGGRVPQVSIGSKSVQEVIVSADFAGVIYVYVNKPKVVAGSSVFLPS